MKEPEIFKDSRGRIVRLPRGVNVIVSREATYRSGDFHPNTQYDYILSGAVSVKTIDKKRKTECMNMYVEGDLIAIPKNTPHLFFFCIDTTMIEWWSGKFKAKYYKPYRKQVEESIK